MFIRSQGERKMIENTGGVGKPFDFTNFNIIRTNEMDDEQDLKDSVKKILDSQNKITIDKDILDWQPGSKIKQNKIKNSLKTQIEESRKKLIDSRETKNEDTKKSKFIGKVTYEFEAYPGLDSNFDEMV